MQKVEYIKIATEKEIQKQMSLPFKVIFETTTGMFGLQFLIQ